MKTIHRIQNLLAAVAIFVAVFIAQRETSATETVCCVLLILLAAFMLLERQARNEGRNEA